MANKIGIVLALDGEQKFTQGMKNAQQASKQLDSQLRELKSEFKDSGNSMEFMAKKQEILKQKEEAYQRTLTAAKAGQSNAKKAYREQAQALEDLEKQLNEAREALSKMSSGDSGYTKQAREVERLSAAVDKQTANYLKAEGRLSSWDNKVNKAESDIRKNSSALEKNAADMSKASSEGGKLADSMDDIGKEADGASKSIKDVGISLGTMAKAKAVDLAGDAMRELGEKAVEAAKYVVEVGSEFEASMSEVEAISGASGQALDQMSQKAKALGASTRFSASEVAQGFKYMSLAGWETEQMLASIDGVVNLAAAGQMELGEASDMVTDYLSAFGLEAEKAGQMADQMAYAQANSNTSVTQLGEAYQNCAANLHAAGQDMETVTSLLEAMANQGTKGHQAGTQLSAMMRDISQKMEDGAIKIGDTSVAVKDSEGNFRDLTDILRDVEKATQGMGTAEKTAALQKTFTAKSIRAVNQVLTEGVDKVAQYENELRNAGGAAAEMSNIMQDNLQGEVTRMKSAAEGLGIAIYDGIKEPLTGLAGLAADAIGGITQVIAGPQKEFNEIDTFLGDVSAGIESVQARIAQSTEVINDAVSDVGSLEHYKNVIVELNDKESLNAFEKQELKNAIDGVIQAMPELADLYNEETGRLDENTAAIEQQISAKQRLLLEEAKQKVSEQALQTMYEASVQKNAADAAVKETQSRISAIENEKQTVRDLAYEYNDLTTKAYESEGAYNEGMARAADIEKELAEHGVNAYEAIHETGETMAGWNSELKDLNGTLAESEKKQKAANDAYAESVDLYKNGAANAENAVQDVLKEIDAIDQRNAAAKEGADVRTQAAEQARAAAAEEREYGTAVEKTAESVLSTREKYERSAEKAQELRENFEKLKQTYLELSEAATGYRDAQKDADTYKGIDEDRYEKAVYDMTRYKAVWDRYGESIEDADSVLIQYQERVNSLGSASDRAARQVETLLAAITSEAPSIAEVGAAVKEVFGKVFPDAAKVAEEAMAQTKKSAQDFVAGVKELEQISRTSADNVRNAWDQLKNSASQTLTFSIETEFDGGADLTTETMNANLQSQLDGYRDYVKNLEVLRQAMAEGIITPEFFTNIEQQGISAANEIRHMAWTLENQENGVEQVKGISDKWTEALNMQDQIAKIIAGDQAALADGLRSMGSTEADFSTLSNLVDSSLAGVDKELQSKIQNLISTAQTVGATIPEGLADSIKSGNIDASGIQNELDHAIQGAMEGLADVAKDAGVNVPDGLIEGIKDGTTDVEEAYNDLISSISSSTVVSNDMQEAAKTAFTTPLANGVREGQEEVVTALTEVTEAAAGALKTDAFHTSGQDAAQNFAAGITSGVTQANTAGKTLADVARIAANNTVGEWQGVGTNMAAGVAAGIAAGQAGVINAAANMAAQALAAAKARLDIHSPSRRFAKELGKQIPAGTAEGIKAAAKVSTAEAEKMSSDTLASATKWLKNYRKKNKVTKQNEQYFWAQMASVALHGSKAYDEAVSKGLSVGLSNNFGVKKTTTTGSGKKKKKVKKSAETYYSEVYSAAQDYFDMLTMNQDMSISAELAYWQKVQANLRKGTTAYVNAAQKIKTIKEKIGGFDVASDLLDSFEIYSELSEKALMDYWDIVRQQYALGTEDRLKADQKYLDAKEKYYKKLTDLETDYSDAVKDKQQELADAIKERAEEIAGAFDLFEEYTSESATGQELLFNMRSQAEGYKFWMDQLGALGSRGILSEELMDQLTQKGPGESAAIYALNSLSDQELAEYNRAFQTKMDLARQQATEDESDLASQISKEIESLTSAYQTDLANVNANLNSEMVTLAGNIRSIAQDQTAQIVAAIVGNGVSASQAVTQAQQASAAQAAAESAAAAAADKAAWAEKIRAVVSSGKKTTKTNSKYNDLRNFIISTFGYDIGEIANNGLYEKLGKLFGISVNKTSTGAQRTAILRAIRGKGFRSGTKRVPVWMDEEGPGSEMVISRSDNAILTRVPAGSAIAPANLTDNLWQWGAFAPAQMMAQIERQQAALARYVTGIVGSTASMASMNGRLVVDQPQISAAGSGDAAVLATIADLLSRYLPGIEENRDVYVGAQKVTSAISDQMSNELAMRSRRRRR